MGGFGGNNLRGKVRGSLRGDWRMASWSIVSGGLAPGVLAGVGLGTPRRHADGAGSEPSPRHVAA